MKLFEIKCPSCNSNNISPYKRYPTKNHNTRIIYQCDDCSDKFSETKNTFMENLKKTISVIWYVISSRTEGMGLNAAARAAGVSKNTVLNWEKRCGDLYRVLALYSLAHEFLKLVIEGDELYTKVKENVPPSESLGWTVVLMDRASRFIWELRCGKKDRQLFRKALRTMAKLIKKTDSFTLFSDGERSYGNTLFEICYELIKKKGPGRPKKTLKKGVKVRIKNKGSQAHKKGPKRPKYQSPWPEHPETKQEIEDKEIHANHVEALNSSLRRKCSTHHRKTNTYAKSSAGLQRLLDVYRVVHNFVRVHFTTKEVPAVALGIIDYKLSPEELFQISMR